MEEETQYAVIAILAALENDNKTVLTSEYVREAVYDKIDADQLNEVGSFDVLIDMGIEHLSSLGVLEKIDDQYSADAFANRVTNFSQSNVVGSAKLYVLFSQYGWDWMTIALSNITKKMAGSVEISHEDLWRPLPVERESEEAKAAIAATEDALETIEGDNGYAVSSPDERNALLSSAKGMLEALKTGAPTKEQVLATLIRPFRYLALKFTDGIIGIAAKKAAALLASWLGI